MFAARVLLCADVTFQQVAKTQERRRRISADVWRRRRKRTSSQGQRTTLQRRNATEMQRNSERSFFLLPEKSDTNFPIPPSKRSRQRRVSPPAPHATSQPLATNGRLTHGKHLPIVRAFLKRRSASVMVVASSSARST